MRLRSGLFAFAVVCAAIGSSKAEASAILFTDRDAFNAAVGEHQLFTEFPLNIILPAPISIFGGNYGGVVMVQDIQDINIGDVIGVSGTNSAFSSGYGLMMGVTKPLTAIGFDLVSATRFEGPSLIGPSVPNDVRFSFGTHNGFNITTQLSAPSFFGALLVDDVFTGLSLTTVAPDCVCATNYAIDIWPCRRSQSQPRPCSCSLVQRCSCGVAGSSDSRACAE